MEYIIENEKLKVTVNTYGAELTSVIFKETGEECMWNADPSVWGRHAPILFPYAGKLTDGKMLAKGAYYDGAQHGFARDLEHTMTESTPERLVMELRANDETKKFFPYDFVLRSIFTLDGQILKHAIEVENTGDCLLNFGLGYHPAFKCPFDEAHDTEDYEFRFDRIESPMVLETMPHGLLNGKYYYMDKNISSIQLTDRLFDNDSFCMSNLRSSKLGIYEKGTGRSVVCDIGEFPYTLIWSQNTEKIRFVCIEPWHSLPGEENGPLEWEKRESAAVLKPGETFSTCLNMEFNR